MSNVFDNQASAVDIARASGGPQKKPKKRPHFWPRSVLGIVALVLAFAMGAALSGVVLFSYYDYRERSTTKNIDDYINGFNSRYNTAVKTIQSDTANGQAALEKALEPLRKTRADGQTLNDLVAKYGPATWFVNTLDQSGQPSVGTAFAVASSSTQTLLLTSYTTIKAATQAPGPPISVRQGDGPPKTVTLQNWDDTKDLALVILHEGNHPVLQFAPQTPAPQTGTQIFILSGLGTDNGSATLGFITDVSSGGIQQNAVMGPQFQGGPIIDSEGKVIAIASRTYSPVGFAPDGVYFAPTTAMACAKVLSCPSGDTPAAGTQSSNG